MQVLINMVCDMAFSLAWGNMNMVNHLTTGVRLSVHIDSFLQYNSIGCTCAHCVYTGPLIRIRNWIKHILFSVNTLNPN